MAFGWVALAITYLLILFWIAQWGDKNTPLARRITSSPYVYSLALAIYCTAWTFFGAVGQSSRDQWMYLPVLLGPILVYLFGAPLIRKLILVSKKQHINTVADFIASRYGKRQTVALVVTIIALLATIPYIALQLKAIGAMFLVMSGQGNGQLVVLIATIFIAVFAIYFGTKQTDVTEYRRGLMLAVSFESLIKLIALLAIGYIAFTLWYNNPHQPFLQDYYTPEALGQFTSLSFWAQTLMAAAAVICLPRQFHVAIIDNLNIEHVKTARWLFPLYLVLMSATIPVIAMAGSNIFGAAGTEPDQYVLAFAVLSDSLWIQILVFVGGLSAATAMIIVATLTLSTMLANDVVLPKLLSINSQTGQITNYSNKIRVIRRIIIGVVLLLGFIYQQQMTETSSLASIGLIAFSLVIQLLPSIIGGLYWKKGHAHGVYAGLLMGFVSWVFWLILPLTDMTISGYTQTEILSQGAIVSLLANTIAYYTFSRIAPARLIDKIQSEAFVHPLDTSRTNHKSTQVNITNGDLVTLLTTFMGQSRCEQLLSEYSRRNNVNVDLSDKPNIQILSFCERALGGVIGSSSARALVNSVAEGKKLDFSEVINFFDGTTQAMQFNMTALLTSLESMEQGISVIDKNLNLVAWNKRYTQLYEYPEEYLAVGTPIEKLMRYNALKGELGPGDVDHMVIRRLEHLRNGTPHRFTRQRADGHVIEMVGNPLPGGGFVTSFNDITSHVEIQQALEEANIDLTTRIKKRTEEVHSINADLRLEIEKRAEVEQELIRARKIAEEANASKTRFLALASHDIIQPLNAAKLYLSALQDSTLSENAREILSKLNHSVNSSEHLISTLLDISRLDQGEMAPTISHIHFKDIIEPLLSDMTLRAHNKGLEFKYVVRDLWIKSDKTFTYRIIQNLISNAIKYTDKGKVLVTTRVAKGRVEVRIYDTGIGIPKDKLNAIFSDFYRVQESNESGVGLGLGVVRRLTQQINGTITVDSEKDKGSCFTLSLPLGEAQAAQKTDARTSNSTLSGLKALCVDDKTENLDALSLLLKKWGIEAELANTYEAGLAKIAEFDADILLIDYQLDKDQNGVNLIQELQVAAHKETPAAILTALHDEQLKEQCKSLNIQHLNKPLKPAKLRALITTMAKQTKNVNRY